MMTTETAPGVDRPRRARSRRPARAIVPGLVTAVGAGVVTVLAAAFVDGAVAADSASMGAMLAVAVLAFGAFSVNLVAGISPRASLPIAMLTYLVQLVVVLAVLLRLDAAPTGDQTARGWLVAGLVLAVLGWLAGHVVGATRQAPSPAELGDRAGVEREGR